MILKAPGKSDQPNVSGRAHQQQARVTRHEMPWTGVATRTDIDRHLAALDHFMGSPISYVELYRMNQFIAEKI